MYNKLLINYAHLQLLYLKNVHTFKFLVKFRVSDSVFYYYSKKSVYNFMGMNPRETSHKP